MPVLHHEATRGATPVEIAQVLSQRFALFPQPDRSEGEWGAWWADYNSALEDMCPAAIEAGMAEYVRQPDSEFFPKPGKLRELAQKVPNRMARAVQAAERAPTLPPISGPVDERGLTQAMRDHMGIRP
jgi:hypothetical protein